MNRLAQSATPKEPHLKAWILTNSLLSVLLCALPIAAQVVPDNTLPAGERSQVTGNPNIQIDGGARLGGNLFHSFSQFSIATGGSAYFNNAADVQNIFSRVTGVSLSNIDGLIRANGTANLFLLNPNGILFGPNASLNIGGSFVATTANAIGFPNGEVFSSDATQPLPSQLLTVNPNVFFFNQLTPKPIINQSIARGTGLQVSPRQNLMLVGGPVQLENGRLTSPGSYVELGGVGGVGIVDLSTANEDWQLTIPDGVSRADISLRNGGQIDLRSPASARVVNGIIVVGDSGSIRILGHDIDLLGSSLWLEIPSSSRSPDAETGGIELSATGSITFNESVLANRLFSQGTTGSINLTAGDRIAFANKTLVYNTIDYGGGGRIGDVNIATGSLSLTDGSQLIVGTRGPANTGSININARDTVSVDGVRDDHGSGIYNIVDKVGIGNARGINITTGSLLLTRGGVLYSYTNGQGNAGNVNINARDTVLMDGEGTAYGDSVSGILTQISPVLLDQGKLIQSGGAVGQGGKVTIITGSLLLTNGGAINTSNAGGTGDSGRVTIQARDSVQIRGVVPTDSAFRSGVLTSVSAEAVGSGGAVSIKTGSLSVSDQGQISTTSQGQGRAGNIQIQARDTVSFDAGDATSTLDVGAVGRGGDIEIAARSLSLINGSQLSASTAGDGNAGNITISAATLSIQNQAEATVSSTGTGSAGSLFVNADRILLNNQGSIRADTTGGGGNIDLRSPFILLRNDSNISTNATGANIPGGNIAIDTRFLIAVPKEDSNISANSEDFRGGNVSIKAFSIFGIQPRPTSTPLSDITATGATSTLNGRIDVTLIDIDPISGLVALPTDLADASGLIAQGCPANQGNSFVITGRGGLPPTPEQQLDDDAQWRDRRRLVVAQQADSGRDRRQKAEGRIDTRPYTLIVEATGWQATSTGEIFLVATPPTVQHRSDQPLNCQGR